MTENRHHVDRDEIAERFDDGAAAILDICPDDLTITAFHAYWGAVALVETEPKLSMQGADDEAYTLISFSGHVFPFDPSDVDLLNHLMDSADHDFEKRGERPYTEGDGE